MLLGDPYKFSVCFDVIKSWNTDDTFCNGVLFLCINGEIYPKEIVTATLRLEIETLRQKLSNIAFDKNLFQMAKEDAFREIYNITYPENIDFCNNYDFSISPSIFVDKNCFLFAVSDGSNVRILASQLDYVVAESRHNLSDITVSEAVLPTEEIDELVLGLEIS